ncbi:MAG: class I SAM-dependent methyltransferase [Kibdelosporangium sp.]
MTEPDRERLRTTFGEDAERYDRRRPGYPPALFDDLAVLTPAGPGARVLEIGTGTGLATVPLAQMGCAIVGVELSATMAAVARKHLAEFPAVEVVVSAFEDWPLPGDGFDLVVSATAFHWIDPAVRMTKVADALRPGGAFVLISTEHIEGGSTPFFAAVQACYERFDPATPPDLRLQAADELPMDSSEFDESGRFGPVEFHRYEWDQTYSSTEYEDLLLTYSGHRALPQPRRQGLLSCVTDLIDTEYEGQITKRYLTEMAIARIPA